MNFRNTFQTFSFFAWSAIIVFFCFSVIALSAGPADALIVQAVDYDLGGQDVAYFDRTPGNKGGQYRNDDVDIWECCGGTYYLGANSTGEWLNYTIEVPYNGNYRLDIQVATPNNNRKIHFEFNDQDKTGPLTLPNTGGWIKWETLSTTVTLNAGTQVMRLVVDYGGLNIYLISLISLDGPKVTDPTFTPNGGIFYGPVEVVLEATTPGTSLYISFNNYGNDWEFLWHLSAVDFELNRNTTVRAFASCWSGVDCEGLSDSNIVKAVFSFPETGIIPIQAEDYDEGGQDIGYFDKTPGNKGGQYRNDDVDIWKCRGGIYYIGANSTGEWLNYTFDIYKEGKYRLHVNVATPNDNRRLHVEFDGENKTGSLVVPNTGGWGTSFDSMWEDIGADVTLSAGRKTMRLVIEYGGFNIDSMWLEYIGN